jgi:hypothetical protein
MSSCLDTLIGMRDIGSEGGTPLRIDADTQPRSARARFASLRLRSSALRIFGRDRACRVTNATVSENPGVCEVHGPVSVA